MSNISLDAANKIIDATIKKSREMNLKPMTAIVLDTGGHLVSFQREDNSGNVRYEVALGKAYASLGLGKSTRSVREQAMGRPHFSQALSEISQGRFIPVLGGILIRDGDGALVGALGVTGDTEENDEIAGIAGIEASGLAADLS